MHSQPARYPNPAFVFDLDGTLVDSVYLHVLAWSEALEQGGIVLPCWRIHRLIGMSGGLIVHALSREAGRPISQEEGTRLQNLHQQMFSKRAGQVHPLPGAKTLLRALSECGVRWALATSGRRDQAQASFDLLEIGDQIPVVTRDDVEHAKPAPDLFEAAAKKLGVKLEDCLVVGDSVWDLLAARRARALGVGLLSGGYGREELTTAGAYRVYRDPAELRDHLEEMGVR
jgi:HAD superfamily hydrolase (TIGR01509 family)